VTPAEEVSWVLNLLSDCGCQAINRCFELDLGDGRHAVLGDEPHPGRCLGLALAELQLGLRRRQLLRTRLELLLSRRQGGFLLSQPGVDDGGRRTGGSELLLRGVQLRGAGR